MAKSKPEIINTVTGGILAVVGLVTAVGQLTDNLKNVNEKLTQAPPSVIWLVIGAVALVGVRLLWRGLSRKSRLLRPEVLLIDPDNPLHLKGRQDEIRSLCEAVEQPLVFLEGESGAGKSALIRSGLLPALTETNGDKTLLPLYINTYGGDWESGPEKRLVSALYQGLSDDQKKQLNLTTLESLGANLWSSPDAGKQAKSGTSDERRQQDPRSSGGQVGQSSVLARIQNELGITPLVIFDQFDDYQAEHRDRFLIKGKWINVKQLTVNKTTRNRFWIGIREALEQGAVHCLFVTRSDTLGGLESVRFVKPETYYLRRLDSTFIIALLEELVSFKEDEEPVISNPQSGWETLKKRLVNNLEYQRRILPIQVRTALKGLIKLPYLSVATYERAGRIDGLEAAYIEDGVASAARRSGLDSGKVLQALLELVDQSNPETPKTRSCSQSQIAQRIGVDNVQLEQVLGLLGQHDIGIVRVRVGDESDQEGEPQWSLYHDYLARAVLAVQRIFDKWQQLLAERQWAWKQAGDWKAKWRALLSPWQLLSLLMARIGGKIRPQGYRGYIGLSTVRLLPYLAVLGLLFIGMDMGLDWQARFNAQPILTTLRMAYLTVGPRGEEVHQLWKLASGSQRFKDVFVEEALLDSKSHSELLQRRSYISQGLFGLDPNGNRRHAILIRLLGQLKNEHVNNESRNFFVRWTVDICTSDPMRFQNESIIAGKIFVAAIHKATNYSQIVIHGSALEDIGKNLPEVQAAELAKDIAATMKKIKDVGRLSYKDGRLSYLVNALRDLGEKVPEVQAAELAKDIVATMKKTTDVMLAIDMVFALSSLGEKLPEVQAAEGAKELVDATKKSWFEPQISAPGPPPYVDVVELNYVAEALGYLGEKLPDQLAAVLAEDILNEMEKVDVEGLSWLGSALGNLGKIVPGKLTLDGAKKILDVMQKTSDSHQLDSMRSKLGSLGENLPETQAEVLAKDIVAAMKKTTEDFQLSILKEKLPEKLAGKSPKDIVAIRKKIKDVGRLSYLVAALRDLGEKLPEKLAEEGGKLLIDTMEKLKGFLSGSVMGDLCSELSSLKEKLPETLAADGAKATVSFMKELKNVNMLYNLGSSLGSLGEKLPEAQAAEVAEIIVSAIQKEEAEFYERNKVGSAWGDLEKRLPEKQAEKISQELVNAIKTTTDFYKLRYLVSALGALGEKLPENLAADGVKEMVTAVQKISDDIRSNMTKIDYERVSPPPVQVAAGAEETVAAKLKTMDDEQLKYLGSALGSMGERLPETLATEIAKRFVAAMKRTMDVDRLSDLGSGLISLGEKLPGTLATEGAHEIMVAMIKATDDDQCHKLALFLKRLQTVKTFDPLVVQLLKSPLAVDGVRKSVLKHLSHIAGQELCDLKSFVEWIEKDHPDVDLESPPVNPFLVMIEGG